ncbi:MAG: DUF2207 domain-containing protein [Candidatus Staskawiczbacteria bacterium]|jgi:uncharacterized membrane protein
MFKKLFIIFVVVASCFATGSFVFAQNYNQEQITNFSSNITVEKSGSLLVTEEISVIATGNSIEHGIYRDFPTKYKDKLGNNYKIKFDLLGVQRNGNSEPYHTENLKNGIRIYIGASDVLIYPGVYDYKLSYRVNREIGFFSDHDELYWNVTGSDWSFPIIKSSATVILPFDFNSVKNQLTTASYVGYVGSKGVPAQANIYAEGNKSIIEFKNSQVINNGEDFTIVVGWPKGLIVEPSLFQKRIWWFQDNLGFILGIFGLLLVFFYYLYVWNKFGRDPKPKSIIPMYKPPSKMIPSSIRYLVNRRFDNKCFTSEIINLAVKGFIKIDKKKVHYYITKVKEPDSSLNKIQKNMMTQLFVKKEIVDLDGYTLEVKDASEELTISLMKEYDKNYFSNNINWLFLGIVLSFIPLLLSVINSSEAGMIFPLIFIIVWLIGWSFGIVVIFGQITALWKKFFNNQKNKIKNLFGAIFLSLFFLPFLAGEIFAITIVYSMASMGTVILLAVVILLAIIFYFLLRQYTEMGLRLVEEVKGFKWFLSVTEKDRMNFFNPPERTPELFEKYLPYALALGVENEWAEQFTDIFNKNQMQDHHPAWFSGPIYTAGALSNFNSGFSSSIASASTPPGSSSGGGGGGSSGGGGGGGGGGGW